MIPKGVDLSFLFFLSPGMNCAKATSQLLCALEHVVGLKTPAEHSAA